MSGGQRPTRRILGGGRTGGSANLRLQSFRTMVVITMKRFRMTLFEEQEVPPFEHCTELQKTLLSSLEFLKRASRSRHRSALARESGENQALHAAFVQLFLGRNTF